MTRLADIAVVAGLGVACYGWGCLLWRSFYGERPEGPGFKSALGLAGLIFIGGALNALRLARPLALDLLLISGLCFAVRFGSPRAAWRSPALWIVAAAALFFLATVVPAATFNFQDDLETYLGRPLRMLQTGSLAGNPYDGLGLDMLGGQSFMQGFLLAHLPVDRIHGFDAVLCLLIAGLSLIELGRAWRASERLLALAALSLVLINPQTVNVTANYSIVCLVLALLRAAALFQERPDPGAVAALGLIAGALIALKSTCTIYLLLFIGLYAAALRRKEPRLRLLAAAGAALAALAPWLAVYAADYLALPADAAALSADGGYSFSALWGRLGFLFSPRESHYGGWNLAYGAIALALLYACARAGSKLGRGGETASWFAATGAAVAFFFSGILWSDGASALRYACPFLIALGAAAALRVDGRLRSAALAVHALILLAFVPALIERAHRAVSARSLLAVSIALDPRHQAHNAALLGPEGRWIREAQEQSARPGQTVLARVAASFQLDYRRNRVLTFNESAFLNPRAGFPDAPPEALREKLLEQGVEVVLWQRYGYYNALTDRLQHLLSSPFAHYRRIARREMSALRALKSLATPERVVYDDGRIVAFRLR